MKTYALVVISVLLVLCGACTKKASPPAPQAQMQTAPATSVLPPDTVTDYIPPQGQYASVTQCPVNAEKVTVGQATPALQYKNKAYYFCCPACASQFKTNPEKYAK